MAITFPTTLDSFSDKVDNVDDVQAVDINDVQDAIEALETKMGINSSAVTASLDYKVNNFFATGRKVYLYENTAPTGWSIVAVTDAVLAVKGGADAYNANGGTQAGTWTQPSHTHTGPSHTHDTTFPQSGWSVTTAAANQPAAITAGTNNALLVARALTSTAGGTEATGESATAATYRPLACVGIIVTKT